MSRLDRIAANRQQRSQRVRCKLKGVSQHPRLSVHISAKHIRAQVIDDNQAKTLAQASTVGKNLQAPLTEQAQIIGQEIAKDCQKLKISQIAFDTGRRAYKGRLQALANAARKEGLKF